MIGVRVACVLAVAAVAAGSLGDNALDSGAGAGGGDRVVLVAPVLAPPRDSRTHSNDRSRQYPILVLLAQQGRTKNVRLEPEAKSLEGNPQPIYVKKLEDQTNNPHSREKRHSKKGHGGGYGFATVPVYISPPAYGGCNCGGYGGHGGGGHGGGGGGYGTFSQSSAQSSSGSYGRKR